MLKKLKKCARLVQLKLKYPKLVYFGAPLFINCFGISSKAIKKGFFSQLGQDELVFTEFFKLIDSDSFPKVFIDIGCNQPMLHSNSYFFEKYHGYKVLAIDALQEIHELWRINRPNAEFIECAVGASNDELSFDVVGGGEIGSMFSSVSGSSKKSTFHPIKTRVVKVRPIAEILAERCIDRAGILSMDIEGYELPALQGIDFEKFFAYIFIIENNGFEGLGNNQIRDMMISNGYIYFARIWNLDDIFIHPDIFALA